MRLSNILIEEVIIAVAGADVVPLVNMLKNKKNVSEFKLAESIKQEVNITRNMLYRLYNYNLVSFMRKKDKKKGWYIYYWTLDLKRVRYLVFELKKKRLIKLKERVQREKEEQFFICPNNCIRLDFDQAMNFEFKCPECGTIIEQEDNSEKIKGIEEEIKLLEEELKLEHKIKEGSVSEEKPKRKQKAKVKKKMVKKKTVKNIKKIKQKAKVKKKVVKKKVVKKKR